MYLLRIDRNEETKALFCAKKVHVLFISVPKWCAVKLKKNTTYKISLLKLKTSLGKLVTAAFV